MEVGIANLAGALAARAASRSWLDRPAYLVGDRVVTHEGVHQSAARWASALVAWGLAPGDRVLIALADGVELVWSFLAVVRLGGLAILVNPRLHRGQHCWLAERYAPSAVICASELVGSFGSFAVLTPEELDLSAAGLAPHPPAPVAPGDPAYAQLTSGTTGQAKAAVHRHADPWAYHRAFAEGAIQLGSHDVLMSVSKAYFAYGLGNSVFFPLAGGASAVLHAGHPTAESVAALVDRHRVSVLFAVPTFYAHLVGSELAPSFSSLRVAVSAGETLTPALAARVRGFLGCPVLDGLGSTEVGQTFVSNTVHSVRDATVGRPLAAYQCSVRDAGGEALPAGVPGRLWVKGPSVLVEYLDDPDATSQVMRDGWLCTGDRAVIAPDGFVSLEGRVDDIEMVGGISVSPFPIEELLGTHPGVTEAAVAAVRDRAGASRLEAFVVPAADAGPDLEKELLVLARSQLAPYQVPRVVHRVAALPRTPTGKLRRFVLRSGPAAGEDG